MSAYALSELRLQGTNGETVGLSCRVSDRRFGRRKKKLHLCFWRGLSLVGGGVRRRGGFAGQCWKTAHPRWVNCVLLVLDYD